jgi:hypothetical protein
MNTKLSRAALEADDLAWAKPYVDEARAGRNARRGGFARGRDR